MPQQSQFDAFCPQESQISFQQGLFLWGFIYKKPHKPQLKLSLTIKYNLVVCILVMNPFMDYWKSSHWFV